MAIRVIHSPRTSPLTDIVGAAGVGLSAFRGFQRGKEELDQMKAARELAEEKTNLLRQQFEATEAEKEFFGKLPPEELFELYPEWKTLPPEEQQQQVQRWADMSPDVRAADVKMRMGIQELEAQEVQRRRSIEGAAQMGQNALQSVGTDNQIIPEEAVPQIEALTEDVAAGRVDPRVLVSTVTQVATEYTRAKTKQDFAVVEAQKALQEAYETGDEDYVAEIRMINAQAPMMSKEQVAQAVANAKAELEQRRSEPEAESVGLLGRIRGLEHTIGGPIVGALSGAIEGLRAPTGSPPPQVGLPTDTFHSGQMIRTIDMEGTGQDRAGLSDEKRERISVARNRLRDFKNFVLSVREHTDNNQLVVGQAINDWIERELGISDPTQEQIEILMEEAGVAAN